MELNSIIYPAPNPSISIYDFLGDDDPDVRNQLLLVNALHTEGNYYKYLFKFLLIILKF